MVHIHRVATAALVLLACAGLSTVLAPPAEAGAIVLEGGDVLHGDVRVEGANVRLVHAALGTLVIPRSRVTAIHGEPMVMSDSETLRAVDLALSLDHLPGRTPATDADAVLVAGEAGASPWSADVGASMSLATGNSELFDLKLDGILSYSRGRNTFEAGLAYVYGEQDGARSAENWHGKTRFERKVTSRLYYFLQVLYDRDDFAELEHRITALGGVGAELARTELALLKAEIGGGATFERRFGADFTTDPTAYVGIDYAYEDPSGRKLALGLDFLPNLDEFDLSRTIFDARVDHPVSDRMSLSLGLRMEHVIDPPGDVESLDVLLTAGFRLKL